MQNTSSELAESVSPPQTDEPVIPDPLTVVGVALIVFGLWLALEGVLMVSVGQSAIAATFIFGGLWLRKLGTKSKAGLRRWMRFFILGVPALFAAYLLGYLILMDRHTPTYPSASAVRFESTLRWAPYEWVTKAMPPYQTKWKSVNTWNILYAPMDRFWFHHFPRSQEEVERLRTMGYYRNY